MKKILFILILLLTTSAWSQIGVFGTATSPTDSVHMISGAADSSFSRIITYYSDTWQNRPGRGHLFTAAYSNTDGLSVPIYIYYRKSSGYGSLFSKHHIEKSWTLIDSLVTTDVMDSTFSAAEKIKGIFTDLSNDNNWQSHAAIQFYYKWTPSASDTVQILSRFTNPEDPD